MRLFMSVDERYAAPLAVTLKSIEQTQPRLDDITASVYTADFSEASRVAVVKSVPELRVEFIDIKSHLTGLPAMKWLSTATYGRLIVPSLVEGVDRLIYLDADTIIRDDLSELWEKDLRGQAIAAANCISVPRISDPFGVAQWSELGLRSDTPFFNAGVLVIDVQAWRAANVTARILAFVRRYHDQLFLADQDAMNAVIAGAFEPLPLRWNQESVHRDPSHPFNAHLRGYDVLPSEEIDVALHNPGITHFTGPVKPWQRESKDPATGEWRALLNLTSFADAYGSFRD